MLKKEDTVITNLSWIYPQFTNFKAVITNGKLTTLLMPEGNDKDAVGLITTNEDYIKCLHKALGDTINELAHQREIRDKKDFEARNTKSENNNEPE